MGRVRRIIEAFLLLTLASCTDFQVQEEDVQAPAYLGVSVSEINFISSPSSFSVTVRSGIKWEVSSLPSWLSLNAINRTESSIYEWNVIFTAAANSDYHRSGIITFKTAKDTIDIPVLQEGEKGKYIAVESISLSHTEMTMKGDDSETLMATIYPSNATDKTVCWTSSNISVATVLNGTVTAKAVGTATISASVGDKYATCTVTVSQSNYSNPEAVDLGLSVKWATCNLGANSPEEHGYYYAWGETLPKSNYSIYKWRDGTTLTKYNYGVVDYLIQLELSDDAARVNWGGVWRMPTRDEFNELINNCTWTWTTYNGENGYLVSSKKNDNSIFLPAVGYWQGTTFYNDRSYGGYWSSSLNTDSPNSAWALSIQSRKINMYGHSRDNGLSVRPVIE